MRECPLCKRCYVDEIDLCPEDGNATKPTLPLEPILDGRYLLERRLGQGGMGVVFEARHIFLKTKHAIKVILPDLVGNDPMLIMRFRQEALAAAAIRHQNIIAVTDFGVVLGTMPYLVMEFVKGRSLQDILATEGAIPPQRAWEFISAIASGVSAAHRQNIVHRDLKPANIMVQDDVPVAEGVKILDFGLAKIKSGELLGSFVQAQTSGLIGSPFYMAPEQWWDEEPDARADIYSLGVILYQMLSGEVPFKGSSIPSIMKKHLTLPPPSFHSKGVVVSPAIEAVVRHSLEKEVGARIDSVPRFLRDLYEALNSSPVVVAGLREMVLMDPNETVASIPPPPTVKNAPDLSEPPIVHETNVDSAFDSLDSSHPHLAKDLRKSEPAARPTVPLMTEDEHLRKQREERERREQEQLEELIAQQAKVLGDRLEVSASMPPDLLIDPETTQRYADHESEELYNTGSHTTAFSREESSAFSVSAPLKQSKSSVVAIGIAAIAIPIAAVAAVPMLVKDGFDQLSDRLKKSYAAVTPPETTEKLNISIAHPKLLSKRFSSLFLVQIYLPKLRDQVSQGVKRQFTKQEPMEYVQASDLQIGQEIRLEFHSPEVAFSEAVIRKLNDGVNVINFIAKPNDSCNPGTRLVLLSISDSKTNVEYQSISCSVEVRDYAFDHLSRPLLSKVMSAAIGIGSLAMFILTLLGRIDTTFGLASGTVAGTLASGIYLRFTSLYQQPKASSNLTV